MAIPHPESAPILSLPPLEEPEVRGSYERAILWSRALLAAFFGCTAVYLLWSIPWLHVGTSRADYNGHVVFQTLLSLLLLVLAFASIRLRDKTRNAAISIQSWTVVRDKLTHMRRHEYFIDRLLFECEKAE